MKRILDLRPLAVRRRLERQIRLANNEEVRDRQRRRLGTKSELLLGIKQPDPKYGTTR